MFYTKYRPQKFSQIVGLESVVNSLKNQVKTGKFSHAYLFFGPRGTGKTSMARLLAKAVNCEHLADDGEPCGECGTCKSVLEGRFLDILEIDAASHRGIDDIRQLRDKIRLAPSGGKFKVYIIDEVHMLTIEAFNALLKTLEEPPAHAIFILATTEIQKVPETIKSRCQRFEFSRATLSDLVKKLKFIADSEGSTVAPEDLERLAKLAQGGFRDAETLLEQVLTGGSSINDLRKLTPEGPARFLALLLEGKNRESLILINSLYSEGQNLGEFINEVLRYLRDLLLVKAGLGIELVERPREIIEEMGILCTHTDERGIMRLVTLLETAAQSLKWSPVPQLPLEMAVLEFAHHGEDEGLHLSGHGSPDLKGESKGESKATTEGQDVGVNVNWEEILKAVKPLNHSLEAFLRSAKPVELKANNLLIEVFYPFHLARLNDKVNKELVLRAVHQVLGEQVIVEFRLGAGKKAEPV
ncbi:MAG: DNA polymerase III subunit gamma/tau [Patescibacteria group bacterium]